MLFSGNRGYFIAEISKKEAEDLIEARRALEEYSIKKLIDTRSEEQIKWLEDVLKQLKAYRPDSYSRKRLFMDSMFHIGIAMLTGNKILAELLRLILERTYLRFRTERIPLTRMDEADREHRMIINMIKRRDKKMALRILDDHIRKVKYNLFQTITREE